MDGDTTICMVTLLWCGVHLQSQGVANGQYKGLHPICGFVEGYITNGIWDHCLSFFVMCMGEEWVKYEGIFNIYM